MSLGSGRAGVAVALAVSGASIVLAPTRACAEQVIMQTELAQVAVDAYTAPATIGGRAQVGVTVGPLDASLKAAVERGGSSLGPAADAWAAVTRPASWSGDQVELGAVLAASSGAKLTLEAGDRARQTLNFAGSASGDVDQLVTDAARYVRLNAGAQAGPNLDLRMGAEASSTILRSQTVDEGAGSTALGTDIRKLFAGLTWRPASKVTVEAGQSMQSLGVAWQGAGLAHARQDFATPAASVTVTPWRSLRWKVAVEQTVAPVNPWQFASYAQIADAGGGPALRPDQGWRYALRIEQSLPKGINLSANLADWRMDSVTELGPVGTGEAPVSVDGAERRRLELHLAAPLEPLGAPGANLSGQLSWQWSQVADPFTGAARALSGQTPFQAQVQIAGAVYGADLSWALTARASGSQSVYQMSQVTTLSPMSGLGGALTYGAGPVRLSLELDNIVGGDRTVTSQQFAGSRADGELTAVSRRKDEARAVRIALRRRL